VADAVGYYLRSPLGSPCLIFGLASPGVTGRMAVSSRRSLNGKRPVWLVWTGATACDRMPVYSAAARAGMRSMGEPLIRRRFRLLCSLPFAAALA
jgi:hypothetical protein